MAKKLMSAKDFEKWSILSFHKNFSSFKEKYEDVVLTIDEWNSLWWADPKNMHVAGIEKYVEPRIVADIK